MLKSLLTLILALVACSPAPRGAERPPRTVLVGIVDLQEKDLGQSMPQLAALRASGRAYTDVLAETVGPAAVHALLGVDDAISTAVKGVDPRSATESRGSSVRLLCVAPSLNSGPELAMFRDAPPDIESISLGATFDATITLLLCDAATARSPHARDATREADLAALDTRLGRFVDEARATDPDLEWLFVGIPLPPHRQLRGSITPRRGVHRSTLQVPAWRVGGGIPASREDTALQLRDLLAPPDARAPREIRRSAWWNQRGGGVFLEQAGVARWLDDRGRWHAVEGFEHGGRDRGAALRSRLPEVFGVDANSQVLVVVRGSEESDLVDVTLTGIDEAIEVRGWGLEAIDTIDRSIEQRVVLSLAAEAQLDGAIFDLGWPPGALAVSNTANFEDAPLLGTSLRTDGGSATLLPTRIAPWSRDFWRAVHAGAPPDFSRWWPMAAVGLHLWILSGDADLPTPPPLD